MDYKNYNEVKNRLEILDSLFCFITEEHRLEIEDLMKKYYIEDVKKSIANSNEQILVLKNDKKD